MYIGEIIKEYRATHNLSQRAFASRTTLSPSYINTLEKIYNPKTNKPYSVTTDVANEIASAMSITIEELLSKINDNQEFTTSTSNSAIVFIYGTIPARCSNGVYRRHNRYRRNSNRYAKRWQTILWTKSKRR